MLLLLLLVTSVVSDSVRPHGLQPTRLPHPWDSPGKNTGVGCHFPLQCMKVESESEVAQSCPTHSDPMDCSLPGSSVHGIFQARVLEWGAIAFSALRMSQTQYFRLKGSYPQGDTGQPLLRTTRDPGAHKFPRNPSMLSVSNRVFQVMGSDIYDGVAPQVEEPGNQVLGSHSPWLKLCSVTINRDI